MNQSQNRKERRSFQRADLRKIRTEYKKNIKTFCSEYFDYNAKKFRKTLFYYQYKQASKMNAAIYSTVTFTYKEESTSPQTETDMVPYNNECASQAEEDQTRVVSNRIDQAAEVDAVFTEEKLAQANELVLSDDLERSVESAHKTDVAAEEASFMTVYQSRSERRSVRRVEPRKIRTNYKREMKGFCCHNYNAKKFKQTSFYYRLKQASIVRTENTSVDNYEDSAKTDTSGGPSTQADTNMVFHNDECAAATEGIHTAADREERDAKDTPGSDIAGTSTVMKDEEAAECFKLEWSILSLLSVSLFDGSLDTLGELQARANSADSKNTELGDEKQNAEDDLDEKEDADEVIEEEEEEEEDERPGVSAKEIDTSFYEKSLKETAWILTPPASIMSIICDEKTSLLLTPPQSINGVILNKPVDAQPSLMGRVEEAVTVLTVQEASFHPVEGIKKKRLRTLKKAGTIVPQIKKIWK